MKTTAKWIKNFQSIVDDGRGHEVKTDLPPAKGGEDSGTSALELTLLSLSSCITTIFVMIATKMHLTFEELSVELEAENPDGMSIKSVEGLVKIKSGEPVEKLEKCLEKTEEMCPVGKIFEQASIPVKVKLLKV